MTKRLINSSATTRAYQRFEKVVERSLNLLSIEHQMNKMNTGIDFTDLTRASYVLATAAMDAYFTGVFVEKFATRLRSGKQIGDELISMLEEAGLSTRKSLELINSNNPIRKIKELVARRVDRMTTQSPEAIDDLFLMYGIKGFSSRVEGIAKRQVIGVLRRIVKRRNAIVHEGDIGSKGVLRKAKVEIARREIESLVAFVSAAETLIVKVVA